MRWFDFIRAALVVVVVDGLAIPITNLGRNGGTWRGNLGSIPSPTVVTWLVDGNNLACSKKVPNDRETILRELSKIASPRGSSSSSLEFSSDIEYTKHQQSGENQNQAIPISNVVIVFDGNDDEVAHKTVIDSEKWLEWTVTDGRDRLKDRADDWIVNQSIPRLRDLMDEQMAFEGKHCSMRVNLVSADKDLQKRVRETRILNGGSFIHPPRFWKDYLPVLQAQQYQREEEQQQQKQKK